jgi:arylsulfatase A-like enzyme
MKDKNSALSPNVIWIFGDQHRAQALSVMEDPNVQTPNIDRLAVSSRTGIAGSPLCSPFRGSLLTSQYPHRCIPGHDIALPNGMPTVATAFSHSGYQTAYIGKWHVDGAVHRLSDTRPAFQYVDPSRRGDFDYWLGYENNNNQYDCWVHGHYEDGTPIDSYKLHGYETDALTDLLIEYLGNQSLDQPFFVALSVQPPHSPYIAPPKFMERHRSEAIQLRPNVPSVDRVQQQARHSLAGYYAMIENLDWNVGRILQTLGNTGLADQTILVFFSDHGDMHGSQARILKCVPWEESIRIPFLVCGSGIDTGLDDYPELINHVDIAPTTLGLCGIDAPESMVGVDYSGYFASDRQKPINPPDSAFLQLVDPGWIYGFASDRERPWRGIVTNDSWKYVVLEGQPWLMYNLNDDPYELANLALDGRFKQERQNLQDKLMDWITRTGDMFELPEI